MTFETIWFAGCVGTSDGDEVRAMCQRLVDSPDICSDVCNDARQRLSEVCPDEEAALMDHPELEDLIECSSACDLARSCTFGVDQVFALQDCGCGTECVRARSEDFQRVFEDAARCHDLALEGACY